MTERIYHHVDFTGYEEALEDLASGDVDLIRSTILGVALYSNDYEFTSYVVRNHIYHENQIIKMYALIALGHLARVHERIPSDLPAIEIIEEALRSEYEPMKWNGEFAAEHMSSHIPDQGKRIQAPALSLAVMDNNEKQVQYRILKGDVLDETNISLETALHHAAYYGHTHLLDRLLFAGATVDLEDKYGQTPLTHAVKNRHIECVKSLLAYNADPNYRDKNDIAPFHVSCAENNIEILELFLKKLNWNAQDLDVQESDCYGNALHIAASYSHIKLLKYLLDLGMDVNRGEKNSNWTPLHNAVLDDITEVTDLLLDYGANPDIKDEDGKTAADIRREENERNA